MHCYYALAYNNYVQQCCGKMSFVNMILLSLVTFILPPAGVRSFKVFEIEFSLLKVVISLYVKCQMSKTFIGGAVCREFESEAPVRRIVIYIYMYS